MAFIFNPNKKRGLFMIPSGATKSPTPTPPSFNNTYSLSFDGVDDKVQFNEISLATDYTVSAWAKRNTTANMFLFGNTATYGYGCYFVGTGGVYLQGSTGFYAFTNSAITTAMARTDWVNWVFKRDSTAGTLAIYVDGVLAQSVTTTKIMDKINTIGGSGFNTASQFIWDGNIDEVAIFNTSAVSLDDLGSSTTPKDLSSISGLTNWYRNGDNGTWKSPQWLIPNNINVANSRFSNYSFEYDGVDDRIVVPHSSSLDVVTGNHSLSFWMKAVVLNVTVVMEKGRNQELAALIINNKIYWGGVNAFYGGTTNMNDGNWHHIVFVATGTTSEIFIDGSSVATGGNKVEASANTSDFFIGTDVNGNNDFTGLLDEISIFNYALSSSEITSMYNSGVPTDISSLSPISHWRMGEDATFSTNWTVTDNGSGGNDGTSANMTIEDRVGDASNSTSNALSYNMDEVDRETDVPT